MAKDIILSQINAVGGYNGVEKLEFIIKSSEIQTEECYISEDIKLYNKNTISANLNTEDQDYKIEHRFCNNLAGKQYKSESEQMQRGLWSEVCKQLITKYGIDTYNYWFSKLIATVDNNTRTVNLKASSRMVEDWISSKYKNVIAQIVSDIGFEVVGLN